MNCKATELKKLAIETRLVFPVYSLQQLHIPVYLKIDPVFSWEHNNHVSHVGSGTGVLVEC